MPKSFDVCIRGDGIVGRTLALLLARECLRVALVGREAPPAGDPATPATSATPTKSADVRAYALNKASRELLESLRAWPEPDHATAVSRMQVWGDDGGRLGFDADSIGQDALAWIVDVPALESQLLQAVRFQPQIERMSEPAPAALTVVCEGQQSATRAQLATRWTVKSYGQTAIAARLSASQPHGGVARQWFSQGDILALLPMGGPAGNSLALVWSVGVERADALQALSPTDFCAALQAVCGPEAGDLTLTSNRHAWPLARSKADRWVGPGWALAGDAAHTVHPLAGQGLNLGLADAQALAGVLAGREYWRGLGDEKLLRRYERARKADVAAMGLVTNGLNGLFGQSDVRWQALRNWGMNGFANSGPLKRWVTRQAAGL